MGEFPIFFFGEGLGDIDWSQMYQMTNVDIANTFFHESVRSVLDKMVPVTTVQPNWKHKSWVTSKTREEMQIRVNAREQARLTQEDEWWRKYRIQRNKVTKQVNNDRNKYYKDKYTSCSEDNNTQALYKNIKTANGLDNWWPPRPGETIN